MPFEIFGGENDSSLRIKSNRLLKTIRNVRNTISMHSSIWALPTMENWVNKLHLLPTSGGYGTHVNQ